MKLQKVATAMHCNWKPPDVPVVLGFNYEGHNAPAIQIQIQHFRKCRAVMHPQEDSNIFICSMAIAYSMHGTDYKTGLCLSVSVSVSVCCLWTLSRSHFLIDFHQNWHDENLQE